MLGQAVALQIALDKPSISPARLYLLIPIREHDDEAPLGQHRLPVVRRQGLQGVVPRQGATGAVLDMQGEVCSSVRPAVRFMLPLTATWPLCQATLTPASSSGCWELRRSTACSRSPVGSPP